MIIKICNSSVEFMMNRFLFQNDAFNTKDWQDGLRALLPNINISFGNPTGQPMVPAPHTPHLQQQPHPQHQQRPHTHKGMSQHHAVCMACGHHDNYGFSTGAWTCSPQFAQYKPRHRYLVCPICTILRLRS